MIIKGFDLIFSIFKIIYGGNTCALDHISLNFDIWCVGNSLGSKRAMCIKWQIWPPLEPKTESCFSPISSIWFIRRLAQV